MNLRRWLSNLAWDAWLIWRQQAGSMERFLRASTAFACACVDPFSKTLTSPATAPDWATATCARLQPDISQSKLLNEIMICKLASQHSFKTDLPLISLKVYLWLAIARTVGEIQDFV